MDKETEILCLELGRASAQGQAHQLLEKERRLLNSDLVKQLAEEVRVAVRVDLQRAFELAEAALVIANETGNDTQLAFALRARANVDWFMGECKSAVSRFREAEVLFEKADNRNEMARTLSSSIQSLALLGEYEEAFAAAAKAKCIFEELGDAWRVARVNINVANIYHRQNRYSEALSAYDAAYQQLLPHRDVEGIGVALHNMAVCLIALDDFHGAVETYERVRNFCSRNEMPLLAAQADYNIAYLHYLRGDYTQALALLRSTRETYRKNEDVYHQALCDLDQSEIYLELSLIEEAAEMARNSLVHFEQLGMGFESARALANLAIATSLQGDGNQALSFFARAREILHGENNQVWPNLIDLYSAVVLIQQNQSAAARGRCLSAAEFFRSRQLPTKQVLALLLLARIDLHLGDLEKASQNCKEALAILISTDSPMLSYQAYFLEGEIHEAAEDDSRAYLAFQSSRSILETLRSTLHRQELKIGLMRNRLEVYSRLVQLCLKRGSDEDALEEALSYVEGAKSRTLRDLILDGSHGGRGTSADTPTDRRLDDLRKELNWYYHRIEREQLTPDEISPSQLEALREQAKLREQEFLRVVLDASDSASVGLALENSKPASLREIRAALHPAAALLEYFSIGSRMLVAVVTSATLQIIPLGDLASLTRRLRMIEFQFSKFRLDPSYCNGFHAELEKATLAHLKALFEEFFAPIGTLPGVQDLIIVPSGALHSLPFQALFDGAHYLVDKFNISYAPSASIFAQIQQQAEVSTGPALILGIPDQQTPFIRQEVEAVAEALPGARVFLDSEATESALRNLGCRAAVIHIASHGIFRQDRPLFSSIKLADSYLTLYDLYRMNLPASLLTLSGCVTGLNVVAGGDELLGLTRGLLYAGAKSLLLSLWEVDDRSTSEFMREFYGCFKSGARKVDAVRTAMQKLREQYPHPYYWAPFKLIGNSLA